MIRRSQLSGTKHGKLTILLMKLLDMLVILAVVVALVEERDRGKPWTRNFCQRVKIKIVDDCIHNVTEQQREDSPYRRCHRRFDVALAAASAKI